MAEIGSSIFKCSACGKHYKWKPEIAAKKVKCKCGMVMQIPAADPALRLVAVAAPQEDNSLAALEEMATAKHVEIPRADVPPPQDDLYDIAEPEKPKAKRAIPVNEGVGLAAAAAAPSPVLGYSRAPVVVEGDDNDPTALKELYVPIGVFALGFILSIIQVMKFNIITFDFAGAIAFVGVRMVFDMILISVACLTVMSWLEVSFGSPGPALLKIASIALVAAPISDLISYFIHDPFGVIGRFVALILIVVMLIKMFDMDIADVRIIAVIVWAARVVVGPFLFAAMLSGLGLAWFGMGGPKFKLGQAEINSDRAVHEKLDMGRMIEAKPWLEDGAHCFGKSPNVVSKKLVDGLIAAGCKNIQLEHDGPFATEMVAELPSDEAKRKQAFDAVSSFCDDTGNSAPVDKGQSYLDMDFNMFYEPPTSAPSVTGAPGSVPAPRVYRRGRIRLGPMNSIN